MEDLVQWFDALSGIEKTFWICAIVSSIIFVIQFVMTFIGIDAADTDFDFSGDAGDTMDFGGALSLFSVRNIVNFVLGFGWGGICLHNYIHNNLLLVVGAVLVGLLFVSLFIILIRQLMKFEANGAIDMNDCVGKACDVYLRIPAARSGKGKVQISINGTVQEFEAMTDDDTMIATGNRVKVLEYLGGSTLLVTKA